MLVAAAGSVLLLIRALTGPFALVHNPIGLECAVAISTLFAVFLSRDPTTAPTGSGSPRWLMAVVLLEVGVAFGSVLSMPLVTDDYIHLQQMATAADRMPAGCLTHIASGSQFYRPLGCLTFWAEWKLWGAAAMPRHAFDLILHGASSLLFFLLLRRLGITRPFDILGALAFTWHGIRPETVAWSAARFDSLALFFSLLAALFVLRRTTTGLIAALLAVAAACLSKESAFVLPLLLAPLVWMDTESPTAIRRLAALLAVAAVVFVIRWSMLSGVGGYVDAAGAPKALDWNALVFAKTFFARIWGILWFPLNWSTPLEWWMRAGFVCGIAGTLLLLKARPNRRRLAFALGAVAIACIPVHHLLLIDASLERSRYLTLASVPFVIALVLLWIALPRRIGILAGVLIVTFQVAAVDHNLKTWRTVAYARRDACREVAGIAQKTESKITITGMPLLVDGAYWSNGFAECLWLDFGVPMGKVRVNGEPPQRGELELPWARFRPSKP